MPAINIELPQISKNATSDQIRQEIPKLVKAKIQLELALTEVKALMNNLDNALKDDSLYTNEQAYQDLQEMIEMIKQVQLPQGSGIS